MKQFRITAVTGTFHPEEVPDYVKENIGQVVYKSVLKTWNDPEFREGYERWKAEREVKSAAE